MKEIVMTEKEIRDACRRIGEQISEDLKNEAKTPLVIGILKGGANFTVDLIKYIKIPVFSDYIQVSSYSGTCSTGKIKLLKDLDFDTKGRTLILTDDVVDTGISMDYLVKHLQECYKPKDIKVCCLIDKEAVRKVPVKIDYVGKVLKENKFLVGYGLDYNEFDRNIPYIYVPEEQEIKKWDEIIKREQF